jgi:hypothetical protein
MRPRAYAQFAPALAAAYGGFVVVVNIGVISADADNARRWSGYYDQQIALNHCLARSRGVVDYVGLFDSDEYLYTPDHAPVGEVLRRLDTGAPRAGLPLGPDGTADTDTSCIHITRDEIIAPRLPSPLNVSLYRGMTAPSAAAVTAGTNKMFCRPWATRAVMVHLGEPEPGTQRVYADPAAVHFRHYINGINQRTARDEPAKRGNHPPRAVDDAFAAAVEAGTVAALARARAGLAAAAAAGGSGGRSGAGGSGASAPKAA